jgi:hypothetical protein
LQLIRLNLAGADACATFVDVRMKYVETEACRHRRARDRRARGEPARHRVHAQFEHLEARDSRGRRVLAALLADDAASGFGSVR